MFESQTLSYASIQFNFINSFETQSIYDNYCYKMKANDSPSMLYISLICERFKKLI